MLLGNFSIKNSPSINYKNISLNVLHSICHGWVLDVTSIVSMKNITYFKSLFLFLKKSTILPTVIVNWTFKKYFFYMDYLKI